MTFTDVYVIFGIPALALTTAYIAVLLHERSLRNDRRRESEAAHAAAPSASQRNVP